jgi:outer membrane protein OmpA-like peptidoglycan-associated protein
MTITRTTFTSSVLAAAVALAATLPAAAQDATFLPEDAGYCDMFRGLSRTVPLACASADEAAFAGVRTRGWGGKTRGIRLHDAPSAPAPVTTVSASGSSPTETAADHRDATGDRYQEDRYEVAAVEQADSGPLAIAMRVQFEFDSARLTPEARRTLDKVAAVLNDQLMQGVVVAIEGHADARGPDDYNLSLSRKRARSVWEYLVDEHGVDRRRLEFTGKGEDTPYDPSDPYAGVNRRVEFRNLTG